MEMALVRDSFSQKSTQGVLTIPQPIIPLTYQTLELPKKDGKPGSCIPCGRFKLEIYDSPHFGRPMPLITGIEGRSEIEMHWGDFPENTRGCILSGKTRTQDAVWETRESFDEYFPLIEAAVNSEEGCWLTVSEKEGVGQ